MIRLDIGCGPYKKDGYIGIDPYVGGDVQAFMWELPYEDSEVDEIYSSHALEHVRKDQVVPTLKEWARVIKPGGGIVIQVPDLVWCCEQFIAYQTNDWFMDIIFGHQAHEGEYHKTGFTVKIMEGYLKEAGLTLLYQQDIESHGQKTLEFIAIKAQQKRSPNKKKAVGAKKQKAGGVS